MTSPKDYLTDRVKLMEKIVNKLIGDMVGLFASEFQQLPSIVISTIGEKVLLDLAEENDKKLLSLLTSEVEKERERLLGAVEKIIYSNRNEYEVRDDFMKLRKALSVIKEKGK